LWKDMRERNGGEVCCPDVGEKRRGGEGPAQDRGDGGKEVRAEESGLKTVPKQTRSEEGRRS